MPPVDVIIGGSPCQNLSFAGNRQGLQGSESQLFYEQIRVIKEMRDADRNSGRTGKDIRPRFMVWENVPGAFSSNNGQDFRAVLEETARIADENTIIPMPKVGGGKWRTAGCVMGDGWSIAWRVLDAQFWGVPQRRRRIALIADFGGESAPEILFERKGLPGNSESGNEAQERTSAGIGDSTTEAGKTLAEQFESIICLNDQGGDVMNVSSDITSTLRAHMNSHPPLVCYRQIGYENYTKSDETATLKASGGSYGGGSESLLLYENHANDSRVTGPLDISPTVTQRYGTGGNNTPIVMALGNLDVSITQEEDSPTVRRLTPLECERLQGLPDNWTNIGDYTDSKGRKRHTSDAARYKAIGNGIALPPWYWVLSRLCMQYDEPPTMASLFDGIGSFPLLWEYINGKGYCLWTSEIEEFPMAVVTKRFSTEEEQISD